MIDKIAKSYENIPSGVNHEYYTKFLEQKEMFHLFNNRAHLYFSTHQPKCAVTQ